MQALICTRCGAPQLKVENGYWVCDYCGSRFAMSETEKRNYGGMVSSQISLSDDVARLLEKCRREPYNARRYANLILDIDPNNAEALKYL